MEKTIDCGLEFSVANDNAMIDACANKGDAQRIGAWMEKMIGHGLVSNARANKGDLRREDIRQMSRCEIKASTASYSSVIIVCTQ